MLVRNIQARTITVDSDLRSRIVQAVDRALVVDTLPPSQQERGNAWAGRMSGVGALAGFWV